ncbi:MAG: type IV toxin-antitoxin system AbiEi family antitoxin [Atribacterota bacterium]
MDIKNYIINQLNKLNWVIKEKEKSVIINNYQRNVDFIIGIDKQVFAAEVKQSKNIDNILSTTFYRTYTQLNSYAEKLNIQPLAIFVVDSINQYSSIDKLKKQFEKYAPDFSWLVINKSGGYAYMLYNNKEVKSVGLNISNNVKSNIGVNNLKFSDLELWLLKLLYFINHRQKNNVRISNEIKTVKNAFNLSKIAKVSRKTANDWVNQMQAFGYMVSNRNKLQLVNFEKLLNQWAGRYAIRDNKSIKKFDFFSGAENKKQKIVESIEKMDNNRYVVTGHYAARLYELSVSNAESLHIYALSYKAEDIEKDLDLVEVDYDSGITIIEPKYKEAILRAQQIEDKKYIVDLIQLYLDCRSLKDRGYEQSEEIMNILRV